MKLRGVWTALVSPMKSTGELDLDAYRRILQDQRDAGIDGVIPSGTTGESPTLSIEEKKTLIKIALEEMKGSKTGVVAGTGSNNTAETVELSKWASGQGVDGVLIVTPYYNKPTQAGMEAHFRAVADAVKCDVMLYNVPGRTGVSLTTETIVKLASHPRIRAIKEATGNPAFTSEILDALSLAGQKLAILSGDDATYLPFLAAGGDGVVSVATNLFPRAMIAIQSEYAQGNVKSALALHQRFYPLFRDLFIESNPVPIKVAMKHAGWCEDFIRAPLAPIASSNRAKLMESLKRSGVEAGTRSPL